MRVALVVSLLIVLGAQTARAETRSLSSASEFQADADAWVPGVLKRLGGIPSVAMTVVVGDRVVLARGYGQADIEHGVPSSDEAVYYIASVTKPFTALMAKILESRGVIDLQSSLASHLPGVSMADSLRPGDVTLRDLLAHTSGIENEPISNRLAYTGEHNPETLWKLLDHSTAADDAPLGTFKYTNTGYNILTLILDRETGTTWQEQLRKQVFEPLGLKRTTAYASLPIRHSWPMAAPYFGIGPSGMTRLYLVKQDNTMQSAGGIVTTARDLGRWIRFQLHDGKLDGRQVVDAAIVRATHEQLTETSDGRPPFQSTGCGLGWMHGTYRGQRLLMHSGGFPGFVASVSFMPDAGIGVAVMINEGALGPQVFEHLAAWAYDWWLGERQGLAEADTTIDELAKAATMFRERYAAELEKRAQREWMLSRPLASYAGTYVSEQWGTLTIEEQDGKLMVTNGNLRGRAEPFVKPETARIELLPGQGVVLQFEPLQGEVERVILDKNPYQRVR